MNIACFTSTYLPSIGGAEICIYNLLSNFVKHGHNVTLYAPFCSYLKFNKKSPFRIIPILPKSDFLLNKIPGVGIPTAAAYMKLQEQVRKHDILHVHISYPAGYIVKNIFKNIPKILTCHGFDIQKRPELSYGLRLDKKFEEKITASVHSFDSLVAISKDIKREYMELGVAAEKINIIPNGATWQRFEKTIDKNAVKKKYGLPADEPLILTSGRNHPKKGFDLIPVIASKLKELNISFRWLIIGKDCTQLETQVKKYNLSDRIFLKEGILTDTHSNGECLDFPCEELIDIYLASDIYAFPSLLEGLPLVLPEAMAAALPVVTTDAPGCPDVTENEKTGFICPKGDVKIFAERIAELLENESIRKEMSENARATGNIYDWEKIAEKHERLYERLLK